MHINRLFFFMLAGTYLYAQDTTSQDASVQKMPFQKLKDQQKRDDKKGVKKLRSKKRQEKVNKAVQAVHGALTQLQNQMAQLHAATLKAAGTVQTARQMAAESVTQPPTQAAASQQQAQAAMKLVLPDIEKVKKDIKNAGKKAQEVSLQAQQMQKTITQHAPADMEIAQHASTVAQQVAQTHAAVSQAASAAQTAAQQVKAAATTPLTPLSPQKVVALHDTAHAATQNLHQTVQGAKTSTDAALATQRNLKLKTAGAGQKEYPCSTPKDCEEFWAAMSIVVGGIAIPLGAYGLHKWWYHKDAKDAADLLKFRDEVIQPTANALEKRFNGIDAQQVEDFLVDLDEPSYRSYVFAYRADPALAVSGIERDVVDWRKSKIYSQIAQDFNTVNKLKAPDEDVREYIQPDVDALKSGELFNVEKFTELKLKYFKGSYGNLIRDSLKNVGITDSKALSDNVQRYLPSDEKLLDSKISDVEFKIRIDRGEQLLGEWAKKNKVSVKWILENLGGEKFDGVLRSKDAVTALQDVFQVNQGIFEKAFRNLDITPEQMKFFWDDHPDLLVKVKAGEYSAPAISERYAREFKALLEQPISDFVKGLLPEGAYDLTWQQVVDKCKGLDKWRASDEATDKFLNKVGPDKKAFFGSERLKKPFDPQVRAVTDLAEGKANSLDQAFNQLFTDVKGVPSIGDAASYGKYLGYDPTAYDYARAAKLANIDDTVKTFLSSKKLGSLQPGEKQALTSAIAKNDSEILNRFRINNADAEFEKWAQKFFKIDKKGAIPGAEQAKGAKSYLSSIGYSDGEIQVMTPLIDRAFSMEGEGNLLTRLFLANKNASIYDFYLWFKRSGYVVKNEWVMSAFKDAGFQPGAATVGFLNKQVGPEEFYKFIQGKGSKMYTLFTSDVNAAHAYLKYGYSLSTTPTADDITTHLKLIGYPSQEIKMTVSQYLDLLKTRFPGKALEGIPADIQTLLSEKKLVALRPGEEQALENAVLKKDINYLKRFKFADQKLAVRDLLKNMEGGELKNTSTQAIQQRLKEMGYADSEIYEGAVPSYINDQLAFTRGARAISAYLKEHEGEAITRDMLKDQVPENAMENQAFRDQVYPKYVDKIWETSSGADALEGREIMEATRGIEVSEESEFGDFVRILVEWFV